MEISIDDVAPGDGRRTLVLSVPMLGVRGAIALTAAMALGACGLIAVTLLRLGDADRAPAHQGGPATSRPSLPSASSGAGNHTGFVHPGVLVTARQLTFVRDQIRRGAEPWVTAFSAMASSRYASLSWQPQPRPVVECGGNSIPDLGCRDEASDALAAYTHALLWYLTRDVAHADKAIEILDAWSGVLRGHTNNNAPIQAGWAGASFVRAAEIIRHTYRDWPSEAAARAATMFRAVFLPLVKDGAPQAGGNWELIVLDAAVGIAVHLDDRKLFHQALARFRARVPGYIYLASDGPHPRSPTGTAGTRSGMVAFWYGQGTFVDGLSQETCRDFGHTAWGLTALAHVAETARIQGTELYAEVRARVVSALELHSGYELGEGVPPWLCGGVINRGFRPVPEVAYNHYASRLGISLPKTKRLIESLRPESANFFYAWETLTHAGNPR